jgi:predicted alpha/beta-fold hydrolase
MYPVARELRVVTLALALLSSGTLAQAGGEPGKLPSDWVIAKPGSADEIIQFIQRLPHDPNMLGAGPAHLRTKEYPPPFASTRVVSLDGTPLAGRWAVIYDGKPHPGVVLVPGTPQSKDLKFMVELARLLWQNGWHVLAIDQRGQAESRRLSPALTTDGLKEPEDVLAAVRHLRGGSTATTVAVVGFSSGGLALVKAMARDDGREIAAGIAVTPDLAPRPRLTPPPPNYKPSPLARWALDQYGTGARSFYEYYERAARMYGVDLETLWAERRGDRDIVRVRAPLLAIHTLDDFFLLAFVKAGLHDGGAFNLAYRDAVKNHPYVRSLVLDRGGHAGRLYLSDPHWFGLSVMTYLKYWQARDVDHVTAAVPPLDVLAEGTLDAQAATYRILVRNHGSKAVGPLDVHLDLPDGARLRHCYLGAEGFGRCASDRLRLTWTIPRIPGGKTTAGPFVAVIDVASLKPGPFEVTMGVDYGGAQTSR